MPVMGSKAHRKVSRPWLVSRASRTIWSSWPWSQQKTPLFDVFLLLLPVHSSGHSMFKKSTQKKDATSTWKAGSFEPTTRRALIYLMYMRVCVHVSHNVFPRLTVGISMLPELNLNKFTWYTKSCKLKIQTVLRSAQRKSLNHEYIH